MWRAARTGHSGKSPQALQLSKARRTPRTTTQPVPPKKQPTGGCVCLPNVLLRAAVALSSTQSARCLPLLILITERLSVTQYDPTKHVGALEARPRAWTIGVCAQQQSITWLHQRPQCGRLVQRSRGAGPPGRLEGPLRAAGPLVWRDRLPVFVSVAAALTRALLRAQLLRQCRVDGCEFALQALHLYTQRRMI